MALSKLAVRRLTKLADFMAKLPKSAKGHFSMGFYWRHKGPHKHFQIPQSQSDLMTCGTTACAIGWAATMPYFKKLGLQHKPSGVMMDGDQNIAFDISNSQWADLFGGHNEDKSPKEWAKRCRRYIRENS